MAVKDIVFQGIEPGIASLRGTAVSLSLLVNATDMVGETWGEFRCAFSHQLIYPVVYNCPNQADQFQRSAIAVITQSKK
ncbi:hypothetical protein J2Y45_000408 [Dyadobacter sp. BE34]|uniref:Uncharacterized protein n=1 Tax=Dyadobacter fermentans TaxID=94254 RepID=A0ABU1QPW3_9BACT|nr:MULTISPECIES: hypothetical protein [Dyadobacter]MDR6803138.1 hypothetical protein [Dyadobacter fermentans]MDR7040880.1 hypothetical protein [Dyadobacter sp. BE242]MDR7195282.1 hypothetical protein [Dyadobacter sp. BE34]MDR7214172.1 hypothetical protein [Dyadobacter sp. BE31]MDR7260690.1 hypothetical protein [Dyadobacter sp. BE32]